MPVILDTNCFANVFSRSSAKHKDFAPLLNWVIDGKGILIYGGSKYKRELSKAGKYLAIFRLLKDVGKAINKNDVEIDKLEFEIEERKNSEEFNDAHLLAISIVSKCRLICSEDVASIKYITDKKYLPKGSKKPVYYTSKKNVKLFDDKYIDECYKPLCKINKEYSQLILSKLS